MDTTQISRRQILVVGSCNTDMVIKAAHLPRPGETILGGTFFMNPICSLPTILGKFTISFTLQTSSSQS